MSPSTRATIDVLVIEVAPDQCNVVAFVDYLLTALLCQSSACLHADFNDRAEWQLRTHDRIDVLATSVNMGEFRTALARFGYYYMSNQVYGGFTEVRLSQSASVHDATIYMANDQRRGFWLKVYVRPHPSIREDKLARRQKLAASPFFPPFFQQRVIEGGRVGFPELSF